MNKDEEIIKLNKELETSHEVSRRLCEQLEKLKSELKELSTPTNTQLIIKILEKQTTLLTEILIKLHDIDTSIFSLGDK